MQTAIVIAVVGVALLYLGRRYTETLKGRAGCACAGSCPTANGGQGAKSCVEKNREAC